MLLIHPPSQTHRMEHRMPALEQLQLPVHATLHWQWTRILHDLLASSRSVQKGLQIFLTASYHQSQELKDGSCMTSLSDCAQMKLACNKLRLACWKYAFLVGGIASKPQVYPCHIHGEQIDIMIISELHHDFQSVRNNQFSIEICKINPLCSRITHTWNFHLIFKLDTY